MSLPHTVQYMEVNEDMHKAIADLSLPTVDFFTVPETQSGSLGSRLSPFSARFSYT